MSVLLIEGGVVAQQFLDVKTVAEAEAKYPNLVGMELVEADQPPGMKWDGAVFTAPPVVLPIPASVTKLQLYDELESQGLDLDQLLTGQNAKNRRRFELAVQVNRNDPLVAAMASGLGWTDIEVDQLFIAAGQR